MTSKRGKLNGGLDLNYGQLIDDCLQRGIPVLKKNGEIYAVSTLLRKVREAESEGKVEAQGQFDNASVDVGGRELGSVRSEQLGGRVESKEQSVKAKARMRSTSSVSTKSWNGGSKFARAMLEDSLIKAHLAKKGIKKVTAETTVPLGIIMASFGNHVDVGDSGLSRHLPDFLESEELKKYWKEKGIIQVTPQTEVPVKFIQLLKD